MFFFCVCVRCLRHSTTLTVKIVGWVSFVGEHTIAFVVFSGDQATGDQKGKLHLPEDKELILHKVSFHFPFSWFWVFRKTAKSALCVPPPTLPIQPVQPRAVGLINQEGFPSQNGELATIDSRCLDKNVKYTKSGPIRQTRSLGHWLWIMFAKNRCFC